MINAAEEGTNIAITGTVGGDVADGDTVTLTVNSVAYTGSVSSGAFSIEVPGTGLTADGDNTIDASVTTTDTAGNSTTATDTETYTVDTVDGLIFSSSSSISNDTFSSDSNADQVTTAKADSITLTGNNRHIDSSTITTGAGDDVISITGDIKGGSQVDMGDDADQLTADRAGYNVVITMGTGADTVTITENVDDNAIIRGGGGADTITIEKDVKNTAQIEGGWGGDVITIKDDLRNSASVSGEQGNDTIVVEDKVENSAQIDGGDGDDTIRIDGEIKGSSSIDGGTGSDTIILNYYSFSDWNSIKDHIDNFEIVQFSNGDRYNIAADKTLTSAPIAIDLDGDGIEYLGLDDGVTFGGDSDEAIRTAWVAGSDAILVFDANNSGTVDESREYIFTEWAINATTDMAALREVFDTNQDGVLDASDDNWDQFKVWQDADSDGVTDEGELKSLDEVGIESIALTYNDDSESSTEAGGDVLVSGQSDVTWADGRMTQAEDAAFAVTSVDTSPSVETPTADQAPDEEAAWLDDSAGGLLLDTQGSANLAWTLADEDNGPGDAMWLALQSDEGEAINLADLIGDVDQDNLADYISVESNGLDTIVSVNPDGLNSGSQLQQSLTIEGVDLTTDVNGNALDTESMNELLKNLYNTNSDSGLM